MKLALTLIVVRLVTLVILFLAMKFIFFDNLEASDPHASTAITFILISLFGLVLCLMVCCCGFVFAAYYKLYQTQTDVEYARGIALTSRVQMKVPHQQNAPNQGPPKA
jgi:hypothetical protein